MLKQYITDRARLIDQALETALPAHAGYDSILHEAMRYSLFAGGKRLRPILLMAAAEAIGAFGPDYIQVACALEMIHTYSLIHDDLPIMDNDDYRRGKPTNHKVYGDALALLAGDGLLTEAFVTLLSQQGVDKNILCIVVKEIAAAAGPYGMVSGQVVDLLSENKQIDGDVLQYMHQQKTGAMFRAAVRSGGWLAGANEQQLAALTEYARQFGLAFQITDDILDVVGSSEKIGKPVGSDERNHKSTYVSLYTLTGAQDMARQSVEKAIAALVIFGDEAEILRLLVRYLLLRES